MPSDEQPTVYVIAGPNGAGKTTFATRFLPEFANCKEFLNADLIAAGLSPFDPESQNIKAGRLLLERIDSLRSTRKSFGFETTLSGRSYLKILLDLQESGYEVRIYFLWLPSAEYAVGRVANRVQQGGHNVPEVDVRRRYQAGIQNFVRIYAPIADWWRLADASQTCPSPIATHGEFGLNISNQLIYSDIIANFS